MSARIVQQNLHQPRYFRLCISRDSSAENFAPAGIVGKAQHQLEQSELQPAYFGKTSNQPAQFGRLCIVWEAREGFYISRIAQEDFCISRDSSGRFCIYILYTVQCIRRGIAQKGFPSAGIVLADFVSVAIAQDIFASAGQFLKYCILFNNA